MNSGIDFLVHFPDERRVMYVIRRLLMVTCNMLHSFDNRFRGMLLSMFANLVMYQVEDSI